MKNKRNVIVLCLVLAAVLLCVLVSQTKSSHDPENAPMETLPTETSVSGTPVSGTNDLGVTYTASIDAGTVKAEAEARTVVVTVMASQDVELDSLGGIARVPEGLELVSMENEELGITEQNVNLENGYLLFYTPDAENVSTDHLITITYTVPAGTPAGTYDLGIDINCISKDYGMDVWEEEASPIVTLTVE